MFFFLFFENERFAVIMVRLKSFRTVQNILIYTIFFYRGRYLVIKISGSDRVLASLTSMHLAISVWFEVSCTEDKKNMLMCVSFVWFVSIILTIISSIPSPVVDLWGSQATQGMQSCVPWARKDFCCREIFVVCYLKTIVCDILLWFRERLNWAYMPYKTIVIYNSCICRLPYPSCHVYSWNPRLRTG